MKNNDITRCRLQKLDIGICIAPIRVSKVGGSVYSKFLDSNSGVLSQKSSIRMWFGSDSDIESCSSESARLRDGCLCNSILERRECWCGQKNLHGIKVCLRPLQVAGIPLLTVVFMCGEECEAAGNRLLSVTLMDRPLTMLSNHQVKKPKHDISGVGG